MARFSFSPFTTDAIPLAAARRAATANGATVVRVIAGSILLEVQPSRIAVVAAVMSGWKYSAERKTARAPERTPLQRAKVAARER